MSEKQEPYITKSHEEVVKSLRAQGLDVEYVSPGKAVVVVQGGEEISSALWDIVRQVAHTDTTLPYRDGPAVYCVWCHMFGTIKWPMHEPDCIVLKSQKLLDRNPDVLQ